MVSESPAPPAQLEVRARGGEQGEGGGKDCDLGAEEELGALRMRVKVLYQPPGLEDARRAMDAKDGDASSDQGTFCLIQT